MQTKFENLSGSGRIEAYSKFSDVPLWNGFHWYYILYTGSDPNAPDTSNSPWYWNCIDIGTSARMTRIVFCPFRLRSIIFINQRHDDSWTGWVKIEGTSLP